MVSPLLAQVGIPVLTQILAEILGGVKHPAAQSASRALSSVEQAIMAGQISQEQVLEANRHAERMTELRGDEYKSSLAELNKTYRTEIESEDRFVRRMRPTFGYFMAVSWVVQMVSIAYVMVFRTSEAHLVIEAIGSLSMIWTVGLSVLGVYVYKRSEDKKTQASSLLYSYFKTDKARPELEGDDSAAIEEKEILANSSVVAAGYNE
jgi:hypothetical protein